jgi:hypothetical protein
VSAPRAVANETGHSRPGHTRPSETQDEETWAISADEMRAPEALRDEYAAEVAHSLAPILAAIQAGELIAPAATRHRIQGAMLALDVLAGRPENDRLRDTLSAIMDEAREQG